MNIDLTQIEAQLISALGVVVLGVLVAAGRLVLKKLGISVQQDQQAALENAASAALQYGIAQANGMIAAKGWNHVDVKNAVAATAAQYAIAQFPAVVKSSGLDPSDPAAATKLATTIMARMYPQVALAAASSPATPPPTPPAT